MEFVKPLPDIAESASIVKQELVSELTSLCYLVSILWFLRLSAKKGTIITKGLE